MNRTPVKSSGRSASRWRLPAPALGLCFALLLPAVAARAADAPAPVIPRDNPEVLVRETTSRLLEISRAERNAEKQAADKPDRDPYYSAVEAVLDQVLDVKYFARGVMATYASARVYKSLQSDAERTAFRDRIERFVDGNKRVFMIKFADALLAFEGERIDVASMPAENDEPDRASVRQKIYDADGQTYVFYYSLHRVEDGSWLVYNVIVEEINVGLLYRDLFAEEVENHQGDVDYVVNNWTQLMLAHDELEKATKEKKAGGGE